VAYSPTRKELGKKLMGRAKYSSCTDNVISLLHESSKGSKDSGHSRREGQPSVRTLHYAYTLTEFGSIGIGVARVYHASLLPRKDSTSMLCSIEYRSRWQVQRYRVVSTAGAGRMLSNGVGLLFFHDRQS